MGYMGYHVCVCDCCMIVRLQKAVPKAIPKAIPEAIPKQSEITLQNTPKNNEVSGSCCWRSYFFFDGSYDTINVVSG